MTIAIKAHGMPLNVDISSTMTPIPEWGDYTTGSISRESLDVTSHTSPAGAAEEISSGVFDPGAVSGTINYKPSDTTHVYLRTLSLSGDSNSFMIPFSNVDATALDETFTGEVTNFESSSPVKGVLTASITVKKIGASTFA